MQVQAKPFLKWAGGKSQLLPEIRKFYPNIVEKYCEPFVGSGAVLFDVIAQFNPLEIVINDINPELTNTYNQIKNNVEYLIEILSEWQNQYKELSDERRKTEFYAKRDQFNSLILKKEPSIEKAALMIYLNKTCFNGLYRVNSKGLFNVPSGAYKNPGICNENNLRAVNKALKNVTILTGDYSKTCSYINKDNFVYIDPPYRPLTQSASFTSYAKEGFNDNDQINLGNFINKIHSIGAKVLLSNSDPKNIDKTDNFFDNLYENYEIHRVNVNRMINCKAEDRGTISELMIACF